MVRVTACMQREWEAAGGKFVAACRVGVQCAGRGREGSRGDGYGARGKSVAGGVAREGGGVMPGGEREGGAGRWYGGVGGSAEVERLG